MFIGENCCRAQNQWRQWEDRMIHFVNWCHVFQLYKSISLSGKSFRTLIKLTSFPTLRHIHDFNMIVLKFLMIKFHLSIFPNSYHMPSIQSKFDCVFHTHKSIITVKRNLSVCSIVHKAPPSARMYA